MHRENNSEAIDEMINPKLRTGRGEVSQISGFSEDAYLEPTTPRMHHQLK